MNYQRYIFRLIEQAPRESFDLFLARLICQAEKCNFSDLESQLKDQIIAKGSISGLRQRAFEESLTLEQLSSTARRLESAKSRTRSESPSSSRKRRSDVKCLRCGETDHANYEPNCPGLQHRCGLCFKMGHFSRMCFQGGRLKRRSRSRSVERKRKSSHSVEPRRKPSHKDVTHRTEAKTSTSQDRSKEKKAKSEVIEKEASSHKAKSDPRQKKESSEKKPEPTMLKTNNFVRADNGNIYIEPFTQDSVTAVITNIEAPAKLKTVDE